MNLSTSKKFEYTRRSNNSQRKQTEQYAGTSRFNSPDSKSTSSQLSRTQTFQVSIQNLMPIITKLKEQNQFFLAQKNKIAIELGQLGHLSESLAKENQALRQHYYQRSVDLQQILGTISINTREDVSDYQHVIHYYREHNGLFNKNIEELDQERKKVSDSIGQLQYRLNQINYQNCELQKAISSRQVKTQQTLKALNKQKQLPSNWIGLDALQKQIADLCIQVGAMKRHNLQRLRQAHERRQYIENNKPMMKTQTIEAIKSAKSLKTENMKLNMDFQAEERNFSNLNEINEKILDKLRDIQAQNEAKRLKISRLSDKIRKSQFQSGKSRQNIKNLGNAKLQKQKIKFQLLSQLKNYEKLEIDLIKKIQDKKDALEKETLEKITKIKQQIQIVNQQLSLELSSKILYVKRENQKTLSNLRYEHSLLNSRTSQLEKVLKSIKNPIKDIIVMEEQLRRLGR